MGDAPSFFFSKKQRMKNRQLFYFFNMMMPGAYDTHVDRAQKAK
jgi:hypothetical protein